VGFLGDGAEEVSDGMLSEVMGCLVRFFTNLASHIQDFFMRFSTNLEVLYLFELSVPHTELLNEVFHEFRSSV
jgi:hypothetical protein